MVPYKTLTWQLCKGHFLADVYYHINEKLESEKTIFMPIPIFHARIPKFRLEGRERFSIN